MSAAKGSTSTDPRTVPDLLRAGSGFDLSSVDPDSTPGFDGGKADGEVALRAGAEQLSQLQERLFAASRGGASQRRGLLVLQAMDTAGKGGVVRHVVGAVDPQGVALKAFKAPTPQERKQHYLQRIREALPGPGLIGVFDRSHYEDVLIVRVHNLVPEPVWSTRYEEINAFEREIAESGAAIVKVMLHISPQEQLARLAERLERADKHWKYNPGDLDERAHWPTYMAAYQAALTRCATEHAPWFVVPANRKWYARLAVQQILLEALLVIDPQWPPARFDVEAEKARLAQSRTSSATG